MEMVDKSTGRCKTGNTPPEPRESGRVPDSSHNAIWMENNCIHTRFVEHDDSYPLVEAVHPARVCMNGEDVVGPTVVTPGDALAWDVVEPSLYDIHVAADRMSVHLTVHRKEKLAWIAENTTPGKRLKVRVKQDETMVVERIGVPELLQALKRMQIADVREEAVSEAVRGRPGVPVVVAKGQPAVASRDATIEFWFAEEPHRIPSVSRGDTIGRKIPPQRGSPGTDVFGNRIDPGSPKDTIVIAEGNVKITENGDIVAMKSGRPRVTGDRITYVDVASVYVVPGNVDKRTGHIAFAGDIVVCGDVTEGMVVESLGNVYVHGNVYQSTITATGDIAVWGKTVSNSRLYSGYYGVLFNRLFILLHLLQEQLDRFLGQFEQLLVVRERERRRGPPHHVALSLIESGYGQLPALAREVQHQIGSIIELQSPELEAVAVRVALLARAGRMTEVRRPEPLRSLLECVREAYRMIERQQEPDAVIDVAQANRSSFMATGNVCVREKGVVQTDIRTRRSILFRDPYSACRGGQLDADGVVDAGIVGSNSGVFTKLRAGRRVTASSMRNCFVQVDRHSLVISVWTHNFEAYVDAGRFVARSEEEPMGITKRTDFHAT